MKNKILTVLQVLEEWLAGAVLFIIFSWCFLMFAEDGAETTPRILAIERQWMMWTTIFSVPLGYPFFALLRRIKYTLEHPPERVILKAMIECIGKARQVNLDLNPDEPSTPPGSIN